jgi:pimeloyl-ACP methyl ester carboxylesterase
MNTPANQNNQETDLQSGQTPTPARARRPWHRRWWVWLIGAILALILLAGAGFLVWASTPAAPMPEALAALASDDQVAVSQSPWISFTPTQDPHATGFIFYPGGRVDARAYAPPARAIAEQGYPAYIVPMPLNLAVLGSNRALDVIAAHPEIERWVIGGHSLGGAMAASFAANQPGAVDGLVLWAAFPPSGADLTGRTELEIASIYGTLDGVATPEEVRAGAALLPADAQFVPIDGGNHAQFGSYGDQAGDNPATISRAEQQAAAVASTVATIGASLERSTAP